MNSTKKAGCSCRCRYFCRWVDLLAGQSTQSGTGGTDRRRHDGACGKPGAQIEQRLATDETARKNFAQDLRRLFAVAEDAQAHGVDKDPDFKRELEYQRSQLLAQFYAEEQGENAVDITDKDVDDYFSQPVNKYKFDQLVEAVKRRNPAMSAELSEQLKEIKQDVGRVYLMEKKAAEQGLEKKPKVRLQLMFQQARMLVQKYATDTLSKNRGQ